MRQAIISSCLIFAISVVAVAEDVPRLPDQPHIVVVGAGSAEADADYLELTIGVSSTKETSAEAVDAANKALLAILNALLELEIDGEDVTTNAPIVEVEYDFETRPPVAVGAVATRTLDVILRDISKYETTVKAAAAHGATRIDEPTPRSNDEAALSHKARQLAIKQAHERAQELAQGFGHTLGPVHGIATGQARQWRWLTGGRGGGLFGAPGGGTDLVLTYTPRPIQRTEYVYAVFLLGPPLDEQE